MNPPLWTAVTGYATCKYCGRGDLAWLKSKNDKWYLATTRRTRTGIEANRTGFHECSQRPGVRSETTTPGFLSELITAGYRALAMKYHPDRGGSCEAMQQVNAAVERLRKAMP